MINSHLLYQLSYQGIASEARILITSILNVKPLNMTHLAVINRQMSAILNQCLGDALHGFMQVFHAGRKGQSQVTWSAKC